MHFSHPLNATVLGIFIYWVCLLVCFCFYFPGMCQKALQSKTMIPKCQAHSLHQIP